MVGAGDGGGNPHQRRRIRSQDERKISDKAIHLGMNNSGTFQKNEMRGLEMGGGKTQLQPLSSPGPLQFLQFHHRFKSK